MIVFNAICAILAVAVFLAAQQLSKRQSSTKLEAIPVRVIDRPSH